MTSEVQRPLRLPGRAPVQDSATEPEEVRALLALLAALPEERLERVEVLRRAVEAGTFDPRPEAGRRPEGTRGVARILENARRARQA